LKNISLLPVELRNYQTSAKKMSKYAVVVAFLILGFVLIYSVLSLTAILPQQDLNSVRQERQDMQKKIAELQPCEDMLNASEAAKKLVSEAMGTNPQWDTLFVKIFNSIPEDTWLSDFSTTFSGNTGELSLRGWAKSHANVAEWLTSLKTMEGLSNIQCQFTMKTGTDDGKNVQFEIKAVLAQGKAFEMPEEGGVK
jgi:Tfp pilus assembly protein PilN